MAATLVYSTATVELYVDWADGSGYAYMWPTASNGSYGDGVITGTDVNSYAAARDTSDGADHTSSTARLGQFRTTNRTVYRQVMAFDTTWIGAGTTVTSATLTITPQSVTNAGVGFDVVVRRSAQSTLFSTTNRESHWDTILANSSLCTLASTASLSANTSVTSPDIGAANVNKDNWTWLALISSRDISGTEPGDSTNEFINLHTTEATTQAYKPKLTVNFTGLTGVGTVYVGQAMVEVPYTFSPAVRVGQAMVEVPVYLAVPSINSIDPYIGTIGDTVTLSGNWFHDLQGTGSVKFGTVTATITSWSDDTIVCVVPSCAIGNNNVTVTDSEGYVSAAVTFRNASGTLAILADGSDSGRIGGSNATYATARSTSSATISTLTVGQNTGFNVYRSFLRFNTSFLGSVGVITSATTSMSITTNTSTTDFDLDIVKAAWTHTLVGNRETNYDLALSATKDVTWRNTSGISTNTPYTSPALDVSYISRTDYTYYAYRSARDFAGTQPSNEEYVVLASPSDADPTLRPYLNLVYTDAGPVITNLDPNPNTRGNEVTINGTGFGASQGDGYVTFAGHGVVSTVTSWSDTAIVLDIPMDADNGYVSVTDDGGLRSAGEYLEFEVNVNINDTLTMTEVVSITQELSIEDDLSLTDAIGGLDGGFSQTDSLSITETLDISTTASLTDTLTLTDVVLVEIIQEPLTDTLELTDTVDVARLIVVTDSLELSDTSVGGGTQVETISGTMGFAWGANADYGTAHANAVGHEYPSLFCGVGQYLEGGTYWIFRLFLKFDTSSLQAWLDDGWTIDSAYLSLHLSSFASTTSTINIGPVNWGAYDPPSPANRTDLYNALVGSGTEAKWLDITGEFMASQYYDSQALDPDRIVPNGTTYYSVISDKDQSSTAPLTYENISIDDFDTPPLLVVTLTNGGTPSPAGIDITAYVPVPEDLTLEELLHEDVSFSLEEELTVDDTELVTVYIDETDDVELTEEVEQRREKKLGAKTMRSYTLGRHATTIHRRGRFGNSGGPK